MKRVAFYKLGLLGFSLSLGYPAIAAAQQVQAQAQTGIQTQTSPPAQRGMTLPSAAPPPPPGTSEHDAVVGRWAVGFLGVRGVDVGTPPGPGSTPPSPTIDAPVIGGRYWLDRMMGIDAGIGLRLQGGDGPGQTAFVLHGGVPLSLASTGHFSFQVVPELNIGFGSESWEVGTTEYSARGFHINLGGRVGGEVHFGFIGVPQLSLQGSVGANLAYGSLKGSTKTPVGETSQSMDIFYLATSYHANPWDIFTGNVAALYYF